MPLRRKSRSQRRSALVEIRFFQDQPDHLIAVEATGHAAWDDFGRDLVCAAASVLLQSLWLGCVEVLHLQVTGQKEAGKLSLRWGTDAWELPGLRALVLTTLGSLQLLAKQYPKNISVAVCF